MIHLYFEMPLIGKLIECYVSKTMSLLDCMHLLSLEYPYYDENHILFVDKLSGSFLDHHINIDEMGLLEGMLIEVF